MAGLVAVKTMGRPSTHGLVQTHTHALTHTHTESHSFGAFHAHGKHNVQYSEVVAGGEVTTQVTAAGLFITPHCTDVRQLQVQHLETRRLMPGASLFLDYIYIDKKKRAHPVHTRFSHPNRQCALFPFLAQVGLSCAPPYTGN